MGIIIQGLGSGTAAGSTFEAKVTPDGKLMTDAAVNLGDVTVDTGSNAYMWGKSGTSFIELAVDSAGQLRTAGTVTAETGSRAYLWGRSGTHYGELTMVSGTENILRTAPNVWAGIGSVVVTGSVNVTAPIAWTGVGSVLVAGSVSALNTQGNAAAGATDSGNPVKVGGIYTATQPTLSDGQRGDIQLTTRGAIKTTLFSNDSATTIAAAADNADNVGSSATANKLTVISRNTVFDGAAWDLMRGSAESGLLVNLYSNTVVGSFAQTNNSLWTGIGSVLVTGSVNVSNSIGSVAITSQPAWTGVGSVLVNGSVTITNSISATTGSTAYLFGKSGTDYYPLLSTSGTDGGVLRIDGSISATTGSQAYLWAKSGTGYQEVVSDQNGYLTVTHTDEFGDGTNALKVGLTDSSGNRIGEGTNFLQVSLEAMNSSNVAPVVITPSGTLYSAVTQSGTSIVVTGSVAVTSSISATTGSQAYLWAKSGTHYGMLTMVSGDDNILRVRPDLWLGVGSVLVTGSVNLGAAMPAWTGVGSVLVNGSVNVTNMIGSVAVTSSQLWTGVGSVLVTGSVNLGAAMPAWTGVGSVLTNGSVTVSNIATVWTGVGSVLVNGSVNVTNAIGSVAVSTNPVNVSPSGVFYTQQAYSGLSIPISVGSLYSTAQTNAVLFAPGAGSKYAITDMFISVQAPMIVTILESGATNITKWVAYLPGSGGFPMNFHSPMMSTQAGSALLFTSSAAGSTFVYVGGFTRL